MTPCRTLPAALALALAALAAPVQAALILTPSTWSGLKVTLESPAEKITQGTRFNLALEVDSSVLPAEDSQMRSFLTTISFGNTVIFDNLSTWTYTYFTDDADFSLFFQTSATGTLGDAFTPLAGVQAGTPTITLNDVVGAQFFTPTPYASLTREFNDRLRWTFEGIIINGDTDYQVTLSDLGLTGVPDALATVVVIDPPPVSVQGPVLAVDEPPAALLSLAGLGALGIAGWRRRTSRA